jgi:hypothetical protein
VTPPASRMAPAGDVEAMAKASPLWAAYGERIDNQSAREILAARMAQPAAPPAPAAQHQQPAGALGGGVAAVGAFLQSREGKQLQKTVMRGVFGMLKKKL